MTSRQWKVAYIFGKETLKANLNSCQKKIVLEASTVCVRPDPGLYLIKGPPGTGKSTVIVNIILQILFSSVNNARAPPLILLTAPSNAAYMDVGSVLKTSKLSNPWLGVINTS
ncbi:hypothetical protein NQ318_000138 [Aromia moschata]|uniref:DNA2/NAM7 helicase helicase domain-containing protein n=1 Tax=Aromia moschata TaxID=1265417 RepID=A0AAV8XII1_9CUCU|nr:hypothetical protein NQ318_000138 [Aromia moschata]